MTIAVRRRRAGRCWRSPATSSPTRTTRRPAQGVAAGAAAAARRPRVAILGTARRIGPARAAISRQRLKRQAGRAACGSRSSTRQLEAGQCEIGSRIGFQRAHRIVQAQRRRRNRSWRATCAACAAPLARRCAQGRRRRHRAASAVRRGTAAASALTCAGSPFSADERRGVVPVGQSRARPRLAVGVGPVDNPARGRWWSAAPRTAIGFTSTSRKPAASSASWSLRDSAGGVRERRRGRRHAIAVSPAAPPRARRAGWHRSTTGRTRVARRAARLPRRSRPRRRRRGALRPQPQEAATHRIVFHQQDARCHRCPAVIGLQ